MSKFRPKMDDNIAGAVLKSEEVRDSPCGKHNEQNAQRYFLNGHWF